MGLLFMRVIPAMLCCTIVAAAQAQQAAPSPPKPQAEQRNDNGVVGDSGEEADEPAVPATAAARSSVYAATDLAWTTLQNAADSPKPQMRIDALAAIGTLAGFAKAEQMVDKAFADRDRDVRLAATIALGATRDPRTIPQLRRALDDVSPQVGFAAATALWKMGDHTGENVLYGVLAGQLKTHEGFISTEMHQANKDLHSPTALAELGAEQGAYALLGPFGIGLDAAKLMMKSGNANTARVLTADLLANDRSERTKKEFLAATRDKDYFVRGAAARALGNYRGKDVGDALLDAFGDKKPSVRLMAAASYLRSTAPAPAAHPARTRARQPAVKKG
jgi:HEAT repeat protein